MTMCPCLTGTTYSNKPKDTHKKWAITRARSMLWLMGNELPGERTLTIQVNHKNEGHTYTDPHKTNFNFNSSPRIQGHPRLSLTSSQQVTMCWRLSYQSTGTRQGSITPSPSQDLLPFISSCTNLRAALIRSKCSRHKCLQRASAVKG